MKNTTAMKSKSALARLFTALLLLLFLGLMPSTMPEQQAEAAPIVNSGQTSTALPNGKVLLLGGSDSGAPSTLAVLLDPQTGQTQTLSNGLSQARAQHSATLLPDGRVLVFGGFDENGHVVRGAEVYDVSSASLRAAGDPGLLPRAAHTATALTDGRVLFAGGVDDRNVAIPVAELWNPRTGQVVSVGRGADLDRKNANATLLGDGSVVIRSGETASGKPAASALVFVPESESFSPITASAATSLVASRAKQAFGLSGSQPAAESTDVDPDALIAIRFSKPVEMTSVSDASIVLSGPGGVVSARVVPSQDGMLAFVSPSQMLMPGARFTVFVDGVISSAGERMPLRAFGFDTARLQAGAQVSAASQERMGGQNLGAGKPGADSSSRATAAGVMDDAEVAEEAGEVFAPGRQHLESRWRTGRPKPDFVRARLDYHDLIRVRVQKLHRKAGISRSASREGVSGIAGIVLRLNDRGLRNVEVSTGTRSTRTDADGRFELSNLSPGHHVLFVDGTAAGGAARDYAQIVLGVDVRAGQMTELPHAVYLPRIRAKDWVNIPSPTAAETVVTHPDLPGMEVRIPAGAAIRDWKGKFVTRIAIVPFPLDRAPFITPTNFPAAFLVHPMGAVVQGLDPRKSPGIRVTYPNNAYGAPGSRANFWMYDPRERGWFIYGQAQVTADGRQVAPDPGVATFETLPVMFSPAPPVNSPAAPAKAAPAGTSGSCDGDPVDLASGLFHHVCADVAISDVLPLNIMRTYRPADTVQRGFGLGTSHDLALYIRGASVPSGAGSGPTNVVLPNGAQIRFDSAGSFWTHTASPGPFLGARLERVAGSGFGLLGTIFQLTMKNGTKLLFADPTVGAALTATIDRNGNRMDIIRSGGLIQRVTSPNGRYVDFTHDGSNRVTQLRDVSGRIWTYQYDAASYLSKANYPDGTFEEYTYDASGRMLTMKDRRGNIMVTNEYDANDRVVRQTLADGAVYQFAYTVDAGGKVTRTEVTDPRGKIRRVDFNSDGHKIAEALALGTAEEQVFSYERAPVSNLLLSVTDPLGRKTRYTYDAKNNVASVTRMADSAEAVTESFTYEPSFNQLASRTNPLGRTTSFLYDAQGNLTQVTDPLGNQVTLTYNAAGQPASVTNGVGKTTQLAYDLGDLVQITDPLGRVARGDFDLLGRLQVLMDPLDNRTQYEYDTEDRTKKVTDPHGKLTQLAYDGKGNLTSVTDANNGLHQYSYDPRNRLSSYTDPLGKSESYLYDGIGNLISFTDRKQQLSTLAYDSRNRRTLTTYADSSTVSNTYDAVGRLSSAVDSLTAGVTRSYDSLDRLTSESTSAGSVAYTYDTAGRRTAMTVSGQVQVAYGYDDADRLTSITQGSASVQFAYDAANRRTTLTLPNGVVTNYAYDDATQLTSIAYALGTSTIGDLNYSYDLAGRRTQVTGSLARTDLPNATPLATYDAANRLTNWNGAALAYDDNGNLLSDGARTYTWDPRNRLVGISGAVSAAFTYDAMGRRLSKVVNGGSTEFVYDGLNPVQERSAGGTVANLLTGLNIDEFFRRTDASGDRDILTDALGSTLALTDTSGAVRTSYTYDPYGNVTTTGDASTSSYQYTGRENDGTGLYFYRARFYHPGLQRFVSEDPLGINAGVNFYAYVEGDPISSRDPLGLVEIPNPNSVVPGGPWTPAGSGQLPGHFYGPKQPSGPRAQCQYVPNEANGGPPGSEGYWKTQQPGQQGWQRFDQKGTPITPEEAHPGPGRQIDTPPAWARVLGPIGVGIWGATRSGNAW